MESKVLAAEDDTTSKKFLNRDVIKYIAMFTMLLNHSANTFLQRGSAPHLVLASIGYFTAVTMCYFLVEGYDYTHSRKNYALRLFIFGVISQIPYSIPFAQEGYIQFYGFNMMFTLLLCFFIIQTLRGTANPVVKAIIVVVLTAVSFFFDWGIIAPIFTMLFVWAKQSDSKKRIAFIIAAIVYGIYNFIFAISRIPVAVNLASTAGAMAAVGVAGVCLIYFYNGKRMEKGRNFSKWFFYLFYPVHLLIIGLIKIALMM